MLIQPPKKNRNKKGLALVSSPLTSNTTSTGGGVEDNVLEGSILIHNASANSSPNSILSSSNNRRNNSNNDSLPTSANLSEYTTTATLSNSNSTNSRSEYHQTLTRQLRNLELSSSSHSQQLSSSSSSHSSSHSDPTSPFSSSSPSTHQQTKLNLNSDKDLIILNELGSGNGGTVVKCQHVLTERLLAKKVVHIATSDNVRKQILRELQIMHDCNSKYIISFYGAYLSDSHICMCMEFMDKGSLDNIYKKVGPIPEIILSKIALAVVTGLDYLYEVHKIMHRDVKPSNILLNSQGQIKICDFGVSGELINSVADTFVGTSTYMSPERISGDPYTVKSDVWSLGITLIELAIGRFPFSSSSNDSSSDSEDDHNQQRSDDEYTRTVSLSKVGEHEGEDTLSPVKPSNKSESLEAAEQKRLAKRSSLILQALPPSSRSSSSSSSKAPKVKSKTSKSGVSLSGSSHQMSILELLQYIVNEPAPSLPKGKFGRPMELFVEGTLIKEPIGGGKLKKGEGRPTPRELLKYEWLIEALQVTDQYVEGFAKSIL